MIKNTVSKWIVFAFNRTSNAAVTGDAANITANLRLDGGAADPIDTTNPTELSDGYYYFDLTADETNADLIVIIPTSTTADVLVIGVPGAVWTVVPLATEAKQDIIDTVVDAIKLKTDTINDAGTLIWTYTVTDSVTAAAIADVSVRLTSDSGGTTTLRTATTNSAGIATFYFDPSDSGTTVYVWCTKAGYNFAMDTEVLS